MKNKEEKLPELSVEEAAKEYIKSQQEIPIKVEIPEKLIRIFKAGVEWRDNNTPKEKVWNREEVLKLLYNYGVFKSVCHNPLKITEYWFNQNL